DLHRKDVRALTGVVGPGVNVIFGVLFGRHDVSLSLCFQRAAWRAQTRSDVIGGGAGGVRTRSVRSWARTISSRSDSESPPHTPYGSCTARACARHRSKTRQPPQICLARASRSARAGPRSFSGWKNSALSIPRHAPRICQSQTSVTATGSLRVSATFVISFGGATPSGAAAPTVEPRHRLFINRDAKHPPDCRTHRRYSADDLARMELMRN